MKVKRLKASPLRALAPLTVGATSALVATALMTPTDAHAVGFRILEQDAEAVARGCAFTATADNPSAIYYNPAGITQLEGQNAEFNLYAISVNSLYRAPDGSDHYSKFSIQSAPAAYYTWTAKDIPLSLGAGVYAPYGLAMEWPEGSPFRTDGGPYRGSLTYISFNPVAAWKVNDRLSIAAGPTINYSQILLRNDVPIPGVNQLKFRGDDMAYGYTLGAMWKPIDQISIGAKYNSSTTMNYGGSASITGFSTASSLNAPFGQFVMAGISYRPNEKWNIEVDADWTDWSSLKTVTINPTPLASPANPTGAVPFAFNWKSSWNFEIGATRYLDNGYLVSFGYFYSQSPAQDLYFSPIVPDANLHVASLGFGHKGDHWSWMLASQVGVSFPRNISNDAINPAFDGSYQWLNGSVDLSVRYHF